MRHLQQIVHGAASSSEQAASSDSVINRPVDVKNLSSNSGKAAMLYFRRSSVLRNLLRTAIALLPLPSVAPKPDLVQKEFAERLEDLLDDDHSPKRILGEVSHGNSPELGVQRSSRPHPRSPCTTWS